MIHAEEVESKSEDYNFSKEHYQIFSKLKQRIQLVFVANSYDLPGEKIACSVLVDGAAD